MKSLPIQGNFFKNPPLGTPQPCSCRVSGGSGGPKSWGSSGPGLFVVFLPFREEKKKSFHYLGFDSDDSFLFYSLALIFINCFRVSCGARRGWRSFPSPEPLGFLLDPNPSAPLVAKH